MDRERHYLSHEYPIPDHKDWPFEYLEWNSSSIGVHDGSGLFRSATITLFEEKFP